MTSPFQSVFLQFKHYVKMQNAITVSVVEWDKNLSGRREKYEKFPTLTHLEVEENLCSSLQYLLTVYGTQTRAFITLALSYITKRPTLLTKT